KFLQVDVSRSSFHISDLVLHEVQGSGFCHVLRSHIYCCICWLALPDDPASGFNLKSSPDEIESEFVCAFLQLVRSAERNLSTWIDSRVQQCFTFYIQEVTVSFVEYEVKLSF